MNNNNNNSNDTDGEPKNKLTNLSINVNAKIINPTRKEMCQQINDELSPPKATPPDKIKKVIFADEIGKPLISDKKIQKKNNKASILKNTNTKQFDSVIISPDWSGQIPKPNNVSNNNNNK
eukprot:CAMPEP_0114666198 /NCGR_PEP_ID=MMETSP0191-20121206/32189_1 /TAXON_ID=126664 /ORGANISM="Sorites sp." /LENGTH=120 /DNA_ID=CAMNT_0001913343 /DNA_START=421 /DNA_END=783 /DNA_ORIENTATION=+